MVISLRVSASCCLRVSFGLVAVHYAMRVSLVSLSGSEVTAQNLLSELCPGQK